MVSPHECQQCSFQWFTIPMILSSFWLLGHGDHCQVNGADLPPAAAQAAPGDRSLLPATSASAEKESALARPQRPAHSRHVPLMLDLSDAAVEKRLMDDVTYLASDELEGRGVRTKGLELASEHIAASFRNSGLVSDWYSGGPFHEFRLFSSSPRGVVQVSEILQTGKETPLKLEKGRDYTSLSSGAQGKFSLPVVFVGYGITAKDIGYDDYAEVDVQGKAVLVLRHEPQRQDANSRFNGVENSPHAYIVTKVKNAITHGAAAIILCTDHAERLVPPEEGKPASTDTDPADALLQQEMSTASQGQSLPVIHLRRTVVETFFQNVLHENLTELESRIDQHLKPESRELPGLTWNGEVTVSRPHRKLRNVVASLEGEGEKAEQTIIVGAHYDHLGRDSWGSLGAVENDDIHNGADDNASGTAVVMEVARQLAARAKPLRHRVLFITFSAEELGLIGSSRYVQDPLFPLNQTMVMLNLDMVGRLREGKLTIYGLETGDRWNTLISSSIAAVPDGNEFRLALRSGGYGPSDHASFFEKGIPVLHFFTGFHPQYHRPTDVASLINPQGMRQIASLVTEMVVRLGNDDVTIQRRTSRSEDDLLADEDFDARDLNSPPPVRLGIRVTTEKGLEGVTVRSIVPESLAARNGIRVGDIILKVDDQAVKSALDIRALLQKNSTAPSWKVGLKRGDVDAEVIVKQAP